MTSDELEIINEEDESNDDFNVNQSDNLLTNVLLSGMLAAVICSGLWIIISFALKIQIGYMALGIGVGVGYTVRWVSKSNSEKFAFISAALSLFGWLLGTMITRSMFSVSIFDYIFCLLAIGEGFYFVAYSKLGPEVEKEEDELDILLREKTEKNEVVEKDKTDDDNEYENRRHNDPRRAKSMYEDTKRNRRGPLI